MPPSEQGEGFAKTVLELIRGTDVENDEDELARLRKLPPRHQLEVGLVLRCAMLERNVREGPRSDDLAAIKSVDAALRFLGLHDERE